MDLCVLCCVSSAVGTRTGVTTRVDRHVAFLDLSSYGMVAAASEDDQEKNSIPPKKFAHVFGNALRMVLLFCLICRLNTQFDKHHIQPSTMVLFPRFREVEEETFDEAGSVALKTSGVVLNI